MHREGNGKSKMENDIWKMNAPSQLHDSDEFRTLASLNLGSCEEKMSSLWDVADQSGRLAELTSHDSEVKEAPLRRDVRSLGILLGEVLK